MDWIRLGINWIGLGTIGLDWVMDGFRMDLIGLGWIGFGMDWIGFEMDWIKDGLGMSLRGR